MSEVLYVIVFYQGNISYRLKDGKNYLDEYVVTVDDSELNDALDIANACVVTDDDGHQWFDHAKFKGEW